MPLTPERRLQINSVMRAHAWITSRPPTDEDIRMLVSDLNQYRDIIRELLAALDEQQSAPVQSSDTDQLRDRLILATASMLCNHIMANNPTSGIPKQLRPLAAAFDKTRPHPGNFWDGTV